MVHGGAGPHLAAIGRIMRIRSVCLLFAALGFLGTFSCGSLHNFQQLDTTSQAAPR